MSDKVRRTARTVLQVVLAVALAVPVLVSELGLTAEQVPWLATVVLVAGVVARIMQADAVESLLQRVLGGSLAANAPEA